MEDDNLTKVECEETKKPLIGRTEWFQERSGTKAKTLDVPNTLFSYEQFGEAQNQLKVTLASTGALIPDFDGWFSEGPFPDKNFYGIGRITQLAIHPNDKQILLAGSAGGGVWLTYNGGDTWQPLMKLQSTLTVGAVAISRSDPNVMYVASGEDAGTYNPSWPGVGIYKSIDSGENWHLLPEVSSNRFSAIVVHPSDSNIFYVAGNKGLHKSIDGGSTWRKNWGLNSLFDGQVTDIVLAHDDPERIYVGLRYQGVYRSTSGGEQLLHSNAFESLDGTNQLPSGYAAEWIKLAIGVKGANGSSFLAVKMGDDGRYIYTSKDAGDNWIRKADDVATASFDEWCSVIAVDPNNEDILYAGGGTNLKRTKNGGATPYDWDDLYKTAPVRHSLQPYKQVHPDQQDIVFDPSDSKKLYLANDGGIYYSHDYGTNWELKSNGLAVTQCYDLDVSEKDPNILGCGGQDVGIFYRDNRGKWTNINWGDGTQVVIDPTDPDIYYYSSQNGVPDWVQKVKSGHPPVTLSGFVPNSFSPWVTIIKLDPSDPIIDPFTQRTLFICGCNQPPAAPRVSNPHPLLFRSTDAGQNCSRVNDSAGNPFKPFGEAITALEFAPSDPNILYLGTDKGAIYKAKNGGGAEDDWDRIDDKMGAELFPNSRVMSICINPKDASKLWVVFGGDGVKPTQRHPNLILNPSGFSHVFYSEDGGDKWKDGSGRHRSMTLPDVTTSAIALDENPNIAYVGTDVGVFRTETKGETWDTFQDGMPRCPVIELCLKSHPDPNDPNRKYKRIYAATMGRGIYSRNAR
ncbi:MAG: WD40/YVTN/BNR-like repeat-containing protein [Methyloligellaceae bacterium]